MARTLDPHFPVGSRCPLGTSQNLPLFDQKWAEHRPSTGIHRRTSRSNLIHRPHFPVTSFAKDTLFTGVSRFLQHRLPYFPVSQFYRGGIRISLEAKETPHFPVKGAKTSAKA